MKRSCIADKVEKRKNPIRRMRRPEMKRPRRDHKEGRVYPFKHFKRKNPIRVCQHKIFRGQCRFLRELKEGPRTNKTKFCRFQRSH
jgi:hypothetical protein